MSNQPTTQQTTPVRSDICAWKCCSYPNGIIPIIAAQVVLVIACLSSTGTMIDCDFAKANINTTDILNTDHEAIVPDPDIRRNSLGFFFFKAEDGECHWEYETDENFENYMDLTSDWHGARSCGSLAVGLGWALFAWSLFFSCVAHPKIPRFLLGGLLVLVATLQAATFCSPGHRLLR